MARQDRIGNHKTTVSTDTNGLTEVVYHSTPVVSFDSKKIILNTGGYTTATTRTRMNQASNQFALGFRVYQKDWDFYVDYRGKTFALIKRLELSRRIIDKACSGLNAKCQCIICETYRAKVKCQKAS